MPKRKKAKAKDLTPAQKRKFLEKLAAADQSAKSLSATVKTLRKAALDASYVGAKPMAAKRRRRKRG